MLHRLTFSIDLIAGIIVTMQDVCAKRLKSARTRRYQYPDTGRFIYGWKERRYTLQRRTEGEADICNRLFYQAQDVF
ncbi:MAG: hypothetical protein ACNS62_21785 [Candidatus Cyclobacteriaceae bacterium M3_2C_046]